MMEESEAKKERDAEVQEMQQMSLSLEGEIALLQQKLAASHARSAHLQQELHSTRCACFFCLVVCIISVSHATHTQRPC